MDPLNTEKPVNKDVEVPKVDVPSQVMPNPAPVSPTAPVAPDQTDAGAPASGDNFGYTETKSNKFLHIFIFVLVVVLLSLVGLFFYKQFTSTTSDKTNQGVAPTVAVSPVVEPTTEEDAELDQIEIPDLDQEMQDINEDIEQL